MLNDRASTLALLHTRRSGKPRDMVEPGPTGDELAAILEAGLRVPDHGKLAPWRFLVIPTERRAALAAMVETAFRAENADASEAELAKLRTIAEGAPTLVVVLSVPVHGHKIPVWEQEMSAGAACQNLLVAGHALGYVGGWITGWAAYSPAVYAGLGGEPGGRVAGFVYFGTPVRPVEERPRPRLDQVARAWAMDLRTT